MKGEITSSRSHSQQGVDLVASESAWALPTHRFHRLPFSFSNVFCIPGSVPGARLGAAQGTDMQPAGVISALWNHGPEGQHVSKTGVKHKPRSVLQGQGAPHREEQKQKRSCCRDSDRAVSLGRQTRNLGTVHPPVAMVTIWDPAFPVLQPCIPGQVFTFLRLSVPLL